MSVDGKKLKPCALGCALGLIWSVSLLMLAWLGAYFHYGLLFVHMISSVYLGYAPTFWGGIIGALWGGVDFFIFGVLIAWLYNCCCCCTHCCKPSATNAKQDGES
jgi:hypothetical protein